MSSLTAVVTTALLRSADFPALLKLSSVRLGAAYLKLTSFLDNHKIPYIPARMGPFLFAKVARHADSWDEEADFTSKCKEAGVSLSSGKAYHVVASEKGWARITFAVDPVQLDEALKRLEGVLVS